MRRWADVKTIKYEGVRMWRCEDVRMWRWENVKMWGCENDQVWGWTDVKMRKYEDVKMWGCEDVKMGEDEKTWKWVRMRRCEDVKVWGCKYEKLWRWADVKMRKCEDVMMRRCEDFKMSCEDVKIQNVKMFDRPPLLKEPFAQTLSGKISVPFAASGFAISETSQVAQWTCRAISDICFWHGKFDEMNVFTDNVHVEKSSGVTTTKWEQNRMIVDPIHNLQMEKDYTHKSWWNSCRVAYLACKPCSNVIRSR